MKNKFFILGLLVALFAVSSPVYADPDPGGTVLTTQAVDTSTAIFIAQADQIAVKEAVKTVAGMAAAVVLSLLVLVLVAPYRSTSTKRSANTGPNYYPSETFAAKPPERYDKAVAGTGKQLMSMSVKMALAKRTKSEVLKSRSA